MRSAVAQDKLPLIARTFGDARGLLLMSSKQARAFPPAIIIKEEGCVLKSGIGAKTRTLGAEIATPQFCRKLPLMSQDAPYYELVVHDQTVVRSSEHLAGANVRLSIPHESNSIEFQTCHLERDTDVLVRNFDWNPYSAHVSASLLPRSACAIQ